MTARSDRASHLSCTILDAGRSPLDRREVVRAIRSIVDGSTPELARDRNSSCYRIRGFGRGRAGEAAMVKVPRTGPQRTNADTTFAWEAAVLARLPAMGIDTAPALLARVIAAGIHYLFTTELPGSHPDPCARPLSRTQLQAILDALYAMDHRGFMHYDLKAANILVDGSRVRFVDFEFARFGEVTAAYAPAAKGFCRDFNASANPFFPARSNVANFEYRTLHRYLNELEATRSATDADDLLSDWLQCKSVYHRRMAGVFAERAETSAKVMAIVAGVATEEIRMRLCAAAKHESLLAMLFQCPIAAVFRVERMLMAYRCAVFERNPTESMRLRRAARLTLTSTAASHDALPDGYRQTAQWVLDRVARSVHPQP